MRKNQNAQKSETESALMPRKLDLRIHTNINDNFEILSSQNSSIISRVVEGGDNVENINQQNVQHNLLEATGETCVIFCDIKEQTEDSESIANNEEYFENADFGKTISSNYPEEISEEPTMIIHKNIPSADNMINFGHESKQSEESEKSVKEFKRKSSVSIINDPC